MNKLILAVAFCSVAYGGFISQGTDRVVAQVMANALSGVPPGTLVTDSIDETFWIIASFPEAEFPGLPERLDVEFFTEGTGYDPGQFADGEVTVSEGGSSASGIVKNGGSAVGSYLPIVWGVPTEITISGSVSAVNATSSEYVSICAFTCEDGVPTESVQIVSAPSLAPEPSSGLLVGLAMTVLGAVRLRGGKLKTRKVM